MFVMLLVQLENEEKEENIKSNGIENFFPYFDAESSSIKKVFVREEKR